MPDKTKIISFLEQRAFSRKLVMSRTLVLTTLDLNNQVKENIRTTLKNFSGNLISTQLTKFRSNNPTIQKFRDAVLSDVLFATTNLAELSTLNIQKVADLLNFKDEEIIEIILNIKLKEFLHDATIFQKNKIPESFSKALYATIKNIFKDNESKASAEEINEQSNFCTLIEFLIITLDWQRRVLQLLVHYNYNLEAMYIKHKEIIVKEQNTESTEIEGNLNKEMLSLSLPLTGEMDSFRKHYQKLQELHPEIFSDLEKNYVGQDFEVVLNSGTVVNIKEHPFSNFLNQLFLTKNWVTNLNNQDKVLLKLLISMQNIAAFQLEIIGRLTSSDSFKVIADELKTLEEEGLGLEITQQSTPPRGRSNSLTANEKNKLEKLNVKTTFTHKRAKSLSMSLFGKKSETKGDIPTPSYPIVTEFDLLNQVVVLEEISMLKDYVNVIEKFTINFEKEVKGIQSTWLQVSINNFLKEAPLVNVLKLLFLAQIIDPFIYVAVNDAVNKVENYEENKILNIDVASEKSIENFIVIIFKKIPRISHDKGTGFKKITPLTIQEILQLSDFDAYAMLNAYNLPSASSHRHPFEHKIMNLISFIKDFNAAKGIKEDYNSYCMKFFDLLLSLIIGHFRNCYRQILDIWFAFNHINCWIKKLDVTSEPIETFKVALISLNLLVKDLAQYDLMGTVLEEVLKDFFRGRDEPILHLKIMLEHDYSGNLLSEMYKLDAKSLLEDKNVKDKDKIEQMQNFICNLTFEDLTSQLKIYQLAIKSLVEKLNKIGVGKLYRKLCVPAIKYEITQTLFRSLRAINAKPETLATQKVFDEYLAEELKEENKDSEKEQVANQSFN